MATTMIVTQGSLFVGLGQGYNPAITGVFTNPGRWAAKVAQKIKKYAKNGRNIGRKY